MSDLDLESVLQKHLEALGNKTVELTDHEHLLAVELDALFLVVMSIMIFIMQCGFAFLEAGTVRDVIKKAPQYSSKFLPQVQEHRQHPYQEHAGRLHRCDFLLGNWLGIGIWREWQPLLWRIRILQLLNGLREVPQVVLPGKAHNIS